MAKLPQGIGSVADFLREHGTLSAISPSENLPRDQRRLESSISQHNEPIIRDNAGRHTPLQPFLRSVFQPPQQPGPIEPPTPVASTKPDTIVRVTQASWASIGNNLRDLTKEKHALEVQVAKLELQIQKHDQSEPATNGLGCQNESGLGQTNDMAQTLKQKEIEIEDLNRKVADLQNQLMGSQEVKKDADLGHVAMEEEVRKLNDGQSGQHYAQELQRLTNAIVKKEKLNANLRHDLLKEQIKVHDLEDEVERLRERVKQEDIDALKERLREKTSQCDRHRSEVRSTEQQLLRVQKTLRELTEKDGRAVLTGGAHLVIPNPRTKLPSTVIACSECYATNNECDDNAKCRRCLEDDKTCARWRCSVKHKTGECDLTPCPLTHDSQGWLKLAAARPEW